MDTFEQTAKMYKMLVNKLVAIAEAVAEASCFLKLKKASKSSYALVTLCFPFSFSFLIMKITTVNGSLWQWVREKRMSNMKNFKLKYEVYVGELLW